MRGCCGDLQSGSEPISFSETPGLGAASMTLTALCAPPLLRLFTPKDCLEDMVPGYRTLGGWNYIWYVTLLVLLQQASVMMLEIFSFFSALDMLLYLLGQQRAFHCADIGIGEDAR